MNEDLRKAQQLCDEARQVWDPEYRVELAEKALQITEDCADAWAIMAGEHREDLGGDPARARNLYQEAVMAGERAVGQGRMLEAAGELASIEEGAAYLRARAALAAHLAESWDVGEAIEHARQIMSFDEEDHLGMRFVLSNWLIATSSDDEALELLGRMEACDEAGAAHWAYHRALLAYRRTGTSGEDGTQAVIELHRAHEINPAVAQYLLGERIPPPESFSTLLDMLEEESRYRPPAEQSAIEYVRGGAKDLWESTDGALRWLYDERPFSGWATLWAPFSMVGEDPPRRAYRAGVEALLWARAATRDLECGFAEDPERLYEERRMSVCGEPEAIAALIEDLRSDGFHDYLIVAYSQEEADVLREVTEDVRLSPPPGEVL